VSQDDPRRGALHILIAAAAFSVMSVLLRSVAPGLGLETQVFLRNAFSLLFLTPWLLRLSLDGLRTQVPHLHLTRALAGVCGIYLFVYAIRELHLAEAVLLNHTSGLFVPFLALFWLREKPAPLVGLALVIGFVGVALMLKPTQLSVSLAMLAGLASGFTSALAIVTIRRNARTEPYARIVFYFFVLAALVSAIPMLWAWETPSPMEWLMMAGAGLFATIGQVFATRAYTFAQAAQIGPWTYSSVVFAGLWGWALWGEAPDAWSWLGAALVVTGSIITLRRT
jgi:drug/metabolite transporter (DMT)-like permease